MLKKSDSVWIIIMIAAVIAAGSGGSPRKATPRKAPERFGPTEEKIRPPALVMATDKNGKITREEFLKFMEREFDRLDANRNGWVYLNELTQPRSRANQAAPVSPAPY